MSDTNFINLATANRNELDKENSNIDDTKKSVNIDVFVETKDRKSFPLAIKSTTTIAELKDIILSTEDIPPDTQRLILAIHLGDNQNLEDQSAWNELSIIM